MRRCGQMNTLSCVVRRYAIGRVSVGAGRRAVSSATAAGRVVTGHSVACSSPSTLWHPLTQPRPGAFCNVFQLGGVRGFALSNAKPPRESASQFWRREAKILAALAVATFVGSVGWQYMVQTVPSDVKKLVKAGGAARLEGMSMWCPHSCGVSTWRAAVAGDIPLAIKKWKQALNVLEASHATDPFHVFEAQFALGDLHDVVGDRTTARAYYKLVGSLVHTLSLPHAVAAATRLTIRFAAG